MSRMRVAAGWREAIYTSLRCEGQKCCVSLRQILSSSIGGGVVMAFVLVVSMVCSMVESLP